MHTLRRYSPFVFSASLLVVLVAGLWPWAQHYIDPDATAYLTLARRWAEGDVAKAVNGYWSPLGVWLTAGLMKAGLPVMKAAVVQNTVAAICFLGGAFVLFHRFRLVAVWRWSFGAALAIFLSYAVYWQLFDDLWMCAALTGSLLILLREDFLRKPLLWLLLGLGTAVAYYAKAYALPFSFLNIAVCGWMAMRATSASRIQWLKMLGAAAAVVVVLAFPWWMALREKYGFWTTGTAGTVNLSWYLVGHQTHRAGIDLLIPPPYPDAPYHWEDPWAASSKALPHFRNSPRLFLMQLVRIGFTGTKFAASLSELSGFALPLWVLGGCLVFLRTARSGFITEAQRRGGARSLAASVNRAGSDDTVSVRILAAQCLTFPALYFLINFESRYLWYLVPVLMVLGALALGRLAATATAAWLRILVVAGFVVSFTAYPVSQLQNEAGLCGADENIGKFLRDKSIRGPFVMQGSPELWQRRVGVIALASGNPWYPQSRNSFSYEELLTEMRRYRILHLYWLGSEREVAAAVPKDEAGRPLPELTGGAMPTIRVFLLSPLPPKPSP